MQPSPYLTSLKKSVMLFVAKYLLPLKQQEEKEDSNWNYLLLLTANHL